MTPRTSPNTPFTVGACLLAVAVLLGACEPDPVVCEVPPGATPLEIDIPPFFPPMDIPPDNPTTVEGVELGRLLFWEKALSADSTMSCGTCHMPEFSFAEPTPVSTGITGAQGTRNAMALINMGWATRYFWDGRAVTLEEQILEPIPHPDEMNLPWPEATARLAADEAYTAAFSTAFGDADISAETVAKAIAQFLRTMVSADGQFDRWRRGQAQLTDLEFQGYEIFNRERGPGVVPGGNSVPITSIATAKLACSSPITSSTTTDSTAPLPPTRDWLGSPGNPSTAAASAPPPCGMWPSRRPTCTTDGTRPWTRSSSTTIPEAFPPPPSTRS